MTETDIARLTRERDEARERAEAWTEIARMYAKNAAYRAAATLALAVLTRLADCAVYWSEYDVPVGIVAEIDSAKARLAGVLK